MQGKKNFFGLNLHKSQLYMDTNNSLVHYSPPLYLHLAVVKVKTNKIIALGKIIMIYGK